MGKEMWLWDWRGGRCYSVWAVDCSPDSDPTGRVLAQYYSLDAAPVLEGEWRAHSPCRGVERSESVQPQVRVR